MSCQYLECYFNHLSCMEYALQIKQQRVVKKCHAASFWVWVSV